MKISFSPPDISEAEINEVADVMRSGWITTGPKTKEFVPNNHNFANDLKLILRTFAEIVKK